MWHREEVDDQSLTCVFVVRVMRQSQNITPVGKRWYLTGPRVVCGDVMEPRSRLLQTSEGGGGPSWAAQNFARAGRCAADDPAIRDVCDVGRPCKRVSANIGHLVVGEGSLRLRRSGLDERECCMRSSSTWQAGPLRQLGRRFTSPRRSPPRSPRPGRSPATAWRKVDFSRSAK